MLSYLQLTCGLWCAFPSVTRVVNSYGPQTRGGPSEAGDPQKGPPLRECGNPAIEERIQNMESHLKLPAGEETHTHTPPCVCTGLGLRV